MSRGVISWSPDGTDNWQSGCTEARMSDGTMRRECVHCYARVMSARLREMGPLRYRDTTTGDGGAARWTGRLTWDREAMRRAFARLGPGRRRFLGSMTDLWHDDCDPIMHRYLAVEVAEMRGVGMFLTKRPANLLRWQRTFFPHGLPRRMWVGVSAGSQAAWDAMHPDFACVLLDLAGIAFVSVEPMTGPVTLGRSPAWVICGAESRNGKPGAPMNLAWVRALRDECVANDVPFFLKQADVGGRIVDTPELDGRSWTQVPFSGSSSPAVVTHSPGRGSVVSDGAERGEEPDSLPTTTRSP